LFFGYQYYDNIIVQEENLRLSMSYLENVTKIDSAIIDLDFNKKQIEFTSKFYVNGTGLMLDSNSGGFKQNDANCIDNLLVKWKDGNEQTLRWTDKKSLQISQYGETEYIELIKTCEFDRTITPNGEFIVGLYGKNQTSVDVIKNIQFKTSFDSSEYDCKNECVFSKNFTYYDNVNDEKKIRNANLDGINPDPRSMKFDLRATNITYEEWSNLFFIAFQLGIGIAVSVIMFVFSVEQQRKINGMIGKIATVAEQQQQIIDEQNKKQKHKRKRYAKMILFGLQLIDYEIEGILIQQKFRDNKSDLSISDADRGKMQIKYYEKAQKRFMEINVQYDDILEIFNPEIENQYRMAWSTLMTHKLYVTENFANSEKVWKTATKIQEEFGKLRDFLIEYVDQKEKLDYQHLFDTKNKETAD
jgi:hypothetical protein